MFEKWEVPIPDPIAIASCFLSFIGSGGNRRQIIYDFVIYRLTRLIACKRTGRFPAIGSVSEGARLHQALFDRAVMKPELPTDFFCRIPLRDQAEANLQLLAQRRERGVLSFDGRLESICSHSVQSNEC